MMEDKIENIIVDQILLLKVIAMNNKKYNSHQRSLKLKYIFYNVIILSLFFQPNNGMKRKDNNNNNNYNMNDFCDTSAQRRMDTLARQLSSSSSSSSSSSLSSGSYKENPTLTSAKTSSNDHSNKNNKKLKPHIIQFVADDLGWNDISGFHDKDIQTPYTPFISNLMQTEGLKFKNLYAEPICSPSRGAFNTGRFPFRWGGEAGVAASSMDYYVPQGEVFLAAKLKGRGYATNLVGKWHQGHYHDYQLPTNRGYDTFFGGYVGQADHREHSIIGGERMSAAPRVNELGGNDHTRISDLHEGKAGWKKYKHYNVSSFNGLYTNIHSVDMFTTRAVDVIKQHYEKYLIAKGKDDDTYVPLFLQLTHQVPHTPVDM